MSVTLEKLDDVLLFRTFWCLFQAVCLFHAAIRWLHESLQQGIWPDQKAAVTLVIFGHCDLGDVELPVGERSCRIRLKGFTILNSFWLKQAQKFLNIGFRARVGLHERLSGTGGLLLDQQLVSDDRLESIDVAWRQHLAILDCRIAIQFGVYDRDML